VNSTGPLTQAFGFDTSLDTSLEHHLETHADAKHRSATREPSVNEFISAHIAQLLHDRVKRSDTRHKKSVCVRNSGGVTAQLNVSTNSRESFNR
jgi:hypothetical protein